MLISNLRDKISRIDMLQLIIVSSSELSSLVDILSLDSFFDIKIAFLPNKEDGIPSLRRNKEGILVGILKCCLGPLRIVLLGIYCEEFLEIIPQIELLD